MATSSWKNSLSARQISGILEVLDLCGDAEDGRELKHAVVDAVSSVFEVPDVTFFFGPTYAELFADPAPILTGATGTMFPEYQDRWQDKDVFALPEARGTLSRIGFADLDQLTTLPAPQRSYVEDYLYTYGTGTASALHLRFANGEALVGMFNRVHAWNPSDRLCLTVLARQLRARTRFVAHDGPAAGPEGPSGPDDPLAVLSPRQFEVARLVSEGMSNLEIARCLSLSELTIKKYVSRIFDATGHRNRASLAAAVHRRNAGLTRG
ncbi:response regulator transcription factor [Rhodococcus sp. NPDC003318]|uniref:response regulator transcription factor n=1 Tax=Rhodococcus sp. NPDC003318 TaxID=3364503 RepID=UPI0036882E79